MEEESESKVNIKDAYLSTHNTGRREICSVENSLKYISYVNPSNQFNESSLLKTEHGCGSSLKNFVKNIKLAP